MSKAKKGLVTNKTYQTQPLFKDKFRPAVSHTHSPNWFCAFKEARAAIKAMIDKKLEANMPNENEIH